MRLKNSVKAAISSQMTLMAQEKFHAFGQQLPAQVASGQTRAQTLIWVRP
jgi:hypothetical protein